MGTTKAAAKGTLPNTTATTPAIPDALVPDPAVAREFGNVSLMTLWRWDHDPNMIALGWPPPIQIRKRNHRSRRALETLKQRLAEQAIWNRKQIAPRPRRSKVGA